MTQELWVKGELHVETGRAVFIQQQLGSNQVYAERMNQSNLTCLSTACWSAVESDMEWAGKVRYIFSA